ncbi:MAG: RNA polymerase sigma factor, partial [Polyangiaceae bacterium]
LVRAKAALAESKNLFELTSADFSTRLSTVQRALYLLFNEGYHGANAEETIRVELCAEALRLVRLLVAHAPSSTPETRALAALFCLHAARLPGRADDAGNLLPLAEQDRTRWDPSLIAEGLAHLEKSLADDFTVFHLEAGIAALHAGAPSTKDTRWGDIVKHYDVLMNLEPSPVVALSRAIAIAERDGPAEGLAAIHAIEDADRLATYPFYRAAIGELELRCGRHDTARTHFEAARGLARNDGERRAIDKRIRACGS